MSLSESIRHAIAAGYQAITIQTHEEVRAMDSISHAASQLGMRVASWSFVSGLVLHTGGIDEPDEETREPFAAINQIINTGKDIPKWSQVIVICRDMLPLMTDDNPALVRLVRESIINNRFSKEEYRRPLIFLNPPRPLPTWLQPYVYQAEMTLPSPDEINRVLDEVIDSISVEERRQEAREMGAGLRQQIIDGCKGLTEVEISNALGLVAAKYNTFTADCLDTLEELRCSIIKNSGSLELVPRKDRDSIANIAGMESVMSFVANDALVYSDDAASLNLDPPKGIVLLGLPGTAKTVSAKAISQIFRDKANKDFPVVIFDIGAVFGSLVGESESRVREALKLIEALGGCILVLNELDKMFGGVGSGHSGDNGVSERVFSSILQFAEKKGNNTYIVGTMNRIEGVPEEFLRKGRFDELFFVDLPTASVRREIFEIHLRKRGIDSAQLKLTPQNWNEIIDATDNFSGADVESVVVRARLAALGARGAAGGAIPTFDELHAQITETRPLAELAPARIAKLREFGKLNCRPAAKVVKKTTLGKQARKISCQ